MLLAVMEEEVTQEALIEDYITWTTRANEALDRLYVHEEKLKAGTPDPDQVPKSASA